MSEYEYKHWCGNCQISRQAAIDAVDKYFKMIELNGDICIDGLISLPSAQPEYRFDEWCTDCKEYDTERHCCPRFNQVIRTTLDEMKSERKRGKWIYKNDLKQFFCSECGYPSLTYDDTYIYGMDLPNYCEDCGADMRGGQDE